MNFFLIKEKDYLTKHPWNKGNKQVTYFMRGFIP